MDFVAGGYGRQGRWFRWAMLLFTSLILSTTTVQAMSPLQLCQVGVDRHCTGLPIRNTNTSSLSIVPAESAEPPPSGGSQIGPKSPGQTKLSAGAITGISIAAVAVLVAGGVGAVWTKKRVAEAAATTTIFIDDPLVTVASVAPPRSDSV